MLFNTPSMNGTVDILQDDDPVLENGEQPLSDVPPVGTPGTFDFAMTADDREPLQHFMTTMVHFCVLRNSLHNSLYSHILATMGLYHQSVLSAMLAWSSLHLAQLQSAPLDDADRRYRKAKALVIKDMAVEQSADVVLTALWFLTQYQLLLADGVDEFRDLLNRAADVVSPHLHRSADSVTPRIGPIGAVILVWMCPRDSQLTYFGGGGRLLGLLKTYPCIYQLIDKAASAEDTSTSIHWASASKSKGSESYHFQACMRLSFRLQTVVAQIILLGRWNHLESGDQDAAWSSVLRSLTILQKEIEDEQSISAAIDALAVAKGSLAALPSISPLAYNRLLLLASFYNAIIKFQTYKPPQLESAISPIPSPASTMSTASGVRPLPNSEECARRIIRISQRVTKDRPNSPRAFWPFSLFHAAVTTKDPIYQSWCIRTFEKGEVWGRNLVKARELLECIIDHQNRSGQTLDHVKAMEQSGISYFLV